LGGRIVFDYEKCNECGICVTECCGSAIELK
jgi:Pyruvate/2-oxoacid:ferredoxin oxidoreductase delta subunit